MKAPVVSIPTLVRCQGVYDLVAAFTCGTLRPLHFHIVDNGSLLHEQQLTTAARGVPFTHVVPGRNLGVAASWNLAMHFAAERDTTLVLANDDITIAPHTLARLAQWSGDALFSGGESTRFACFIIEPSLALEEVGEFDEQFFPAYYEDDDYRYRAQLAGWQESWIPDAALGIETQGQGTSRALGPAWAGTLAAQYHHNRRLYEAKWGGFPPYERYSEPYQPSSKRVRRA